MPTFKSVLDDEIKSAKFVTRKWMTKIYFSIIVVSLTLDGIWMAKNVNLKR